MTDKGFVYVVPMQRKGEVLQAMKQFAKEIGAPDTFVADMSGKQMSKEVKAFAMTLEQPSEPWRKEHHGPTKLSSMWDC